MSKGFIGGTVPQKFTRAEMTAKKLKKLDEYHATTILWPSEESAWENIKKAAEGVEIYCDFMEVDGLFEHTILIGRGNEFAEYIKRCINENPSCKTFFFDCKEIVPLQIVNEPQ